MSLTFAASRLGGLGSQSVWRRSEKIPGRGAAGIIFGCQDFDLVSATTPPLHDTFNFFRTANNSSTAE
jgi:hypothetical protein